MPPSLSSHHPTTMPRTDQEMLERASRSNNTQTRMLYLIHRQLLEVEHALICEKNHSMDEYLMLHPHLKDGELS